MVFADTLNCDGGGVFDIINGDWEGEGCGGGVDAILICGVMHRIEPLVAAAPLPPA